MKPELPAAGYGKTVAVCGIDPSEVAVSPVGRSAEGVKMDLLQCATQSNGETQVKTLLAARSRTEKDIWTLCAPKVIQQSAGGDQISWCAMFPSDSDRLLDIIFWG